MASRPGRMTGELVYLTPCAYCLVQEAVIVDEYDVVVLGTGAAGLTAAIRAHAGGADVGLFEKSDQIGGTAAWSGGMAWIPGNPHMEAGDAIDRRAETLTCLASLSNDMIDARAAETFVDQGPDVVRWLEANSPVRFYSIAGFPDYHPENPGAKTPGGRTASPRGRSCPGC